MSNVVEKRMVVVVGLDSSVTNRHEFLAKLQEEDPDAVMDPEGNPSIGWYRTCLIPAKIRCMENVTDSFYSGTQE